MTSKTPQFDEAIDKILADLKPHEKKCKQCQKTFQIYAEDIDFYKKSRVPEPKLCPECRRQRRLAFANYTTLYKRKCDVPGHSEEVISSIPPGTKFPIYDFDYYWSDQRNPEDYAMVYDSNKSFLKQFQEFFDKSPQPAVTRDPGSVGSDYTLYGAQLKNCYYTFGGGLGTENVSYSHWALTSKDCLDILIPIHTELSYEGVFPDHCYNCNFVYFSNDCLNSSFLYDCRNCSDCFGCVNLRNKKYCFWNEQLTAEEYKKRLTETNLGDRNVVRENLNKFKNFIKSLPVRSSHNDHSENVVGNFIIGSKNCFMSFWALDSENLRYVDFVMKMRDSMDCVMSYNTERLYECSIVTFEGYNVKFSVNSRASGDSEFIFNCRGCKNCFGCIGLINKQYCIFNKQYTEDEYWEIVDEIKTKMLEEGIYGEMLPLSFGPFPYNATLAEIVFPSSEEKIKSLGGYWYEVESKTPQNVEIVKILDVPEDIKNVTDEILTKGLLGEGQSKPYRIIKSELEFYRRKNLPIPTFHPYERMVERFKWVNNFKVVKDVCYKCGREIYTSNETKDGFRPYCEQCYNSEVV